MGNKQISEMVAEKFADYRIEVYKLRAVIQLCPLPILFGHHDGTTIISINPAYTFFMGGTLEDVQNMGWLNHWEEQDRPKLRDFWLDVCTSGKTKSIQARYIFPPDGRKREARVSATKLAEDGVISFVFPEICWDVPLPQQIISPSQLDELVYRST